MHFDVILIGDLRVPGGTSRQLANEIRALSGAGYSVGLVNVELPHARGEKPLDPLVRARIAAGEAVLVEEGLEDLSARLLIFENPRAFMQPGPPHLQVRAEHALIAMHFPPRDGAGALTFEADRVLRTCGAITSAPLRWAATSRLTRSLFVEIYPSLGLMDGILPCIVFADEFQVQRRRAPGARPVIGRHSRPQADKWPADRRTLLQAYPAGKELDVVLLGADEQLQRLAGRYPANWRVHAFNEITPRQLLEQIDFFVYHHHPHWVEAFGLAVAEAMASGAVAILPPYMRTNFGEGALYAGPEQTLSLVRRLHRDPAAYASQARRGTEFIRRHHSAAAYLAALRPLLGTGTRRRTPRRQARYEVLVLADMRRPGVEAQRVAREVRATAHAGYRVALLHCTTGKPGGRVRPEIDRCVRERVAEVADPVSTPIAAKLLISHGAQAFLRLPDAAAARMRFEHLVMVVDAGLTREEAGLVRKLAAASRDANLSWAPVDVAARLHLEGLGLGSVEPVLDWHAVCPLHPYPQQAPRKSPALAVVMPRVPDGAGLRRLAAALPRDGSVRVRLYGAPSDKTLQPLLPLPGWETFKSHELPLAKFLDGADALVCIDAKSFSDVAAAEAMARGLPVLAPPALRRHLGEGAVYAAPERLASVVHALLRSRRRYLAASQAALARAADLHTPGAHAVRLRSLIGKSPRRSAAVPRGRARRVLMFSQNGVGLGHVVRQLAVSRCLSRSHEVVYCSMSQAIDVIAAQGYAVEHLPSHVYTGVSYADWHGWARAQLEQMLDFHDVGAVVLDGSVPYLGLLEAVAPRPDVKLVWLRRPMWPANPESNVRLAQQRFFDLVIEPEELAGALDQGPTVAWRERALQVPPIRLLERSEVLPREAARRALGLDPGRPAMLVQLGSGANHDVSAIVDRLVTLARLHPTLQVVLAEWHNADRPLDLWDGVLCLRGFPYSRYFDAFDFSFSAAGYNSFHEIMDAGLPTAFVPNPRDYMDGQAIRAAFAASRGAGLHCEGGALALGAALAKLMDPAVRRGMRSAMRRLKRPNGAAAAAEAVAALLEGERA